MQEGGREQQWEREENNMGRSRKGGEGRGTRGREGNNRAWEGRRGTDNWWERGRVAAAHTHTRYGGR